ncbi:hypothetical protein HDU76_007705 [Blyttiomyces sp. JEL0837]|nr:hypothetical protein HDU76_007705 [Blyttiomyces sp. JEL0837]
MMALGVANEPNRSFEDVVPYLKGEQVKKKNIIAILIDQSKESESAFKSVVENFVPEYDPFDTQFIIFSPQIPMTLPITPSTDNGPRQATRDFLTQRSQQLFSASYSGDSSKLPPAYTTTNDIKASSNTEKDNSAWYGHVRAIYYRRDKGDEIANWLPKFGVTYTIVAMHQDKPKSPSASASHWTLSHEITKHVLLRAKEGSAVKVVKCEVEESVNGDEMVMIEKGAYAAATAEFQPPEGKMFPSISKYGLTGGFCFF